MENNNKVVDSKSIPFRLIEQKEETNNLVIILPGADYTTQAPLLHFTTGLFYNKNAAIQFWSSCVLSFYIAVYRFGSKQIIPLSFPK